MNTTVLLILFTFSFVTVNTNTDQNDNEEPCVCTPWWQCEKYKDLSTKPTFDSAQEDFFNSILTNKTIFRKYRNTICPAVFDICCPKICGQRKTSGVKSRILGYNDDAVFGEFPWMLGVLVKKKMTCGASLIHPQVALTAAHCVELTETYEVRAGEWNWKSTNELLSHQDRAVDKIISHQDYQRTSLKNDIALLILVSEFKLTDHISVACLPRRGEFFDRNQCVVSGWGKNAATSTKYQPVLKKATLPIVAKDVCENSLQTALLGPSFKLHDSFLCAGGMGKDTCKGDGGSPLVCPMLFKEGTYIQAGIVSWGLKCGIYDTPGVYVDVLKFSDWVDAKMTEHDFDISIYRVGI